MEISQAARDGLKKTLGGTADELVEVMGRDVLKSRGCKTVGNRMGE
jgi:hypothetical protein